MKGLVKYLAYLGAGLFFFVFFLFWTFPYDVLKGRILHQIEDGLGGNYRIKVQKMSAGLITGFTFKNVEVVKREGGSDVLLFKTPKLKINPSLLAAISQKTKLKFDVVTTKGEVYGKYFDSPDRTEISVTFDELNLTDLKFLNILYGLGFKGILDGDFEMSFYKKSPDKNSGKINLQLINLALDPYKIKMDPTAPEATMDLPKITLTGGKNSKLVAEMNKNALEVKDFSFNGGDLDLSLKGKITLAPLMDDYRIDLQGKFKLSPQLSQAIPLLSLFEQQKQPDGSYELQLNGKFTKPSVTVGRFKLPF